MIGVSKSGLSLIVLPAGPAESTPFWERPRSRLGPACFTPPAMSAAGGGPANPVNYRQRRGTVSRCAGAAGARGRGGKFGHVGHVTLRNAVRVYCSEACGAESHGQVT